MCCKLVIVFTSRDVVRVLRAIVVACARCARIDCAVDVAQITCHIREQKRAGAESKNAYELRAVVYIGFRHYAICFFSLKKWLPDASLASPVCNFSKGC